MKSNTNYEEHISTFCKDNGRQASPIAHAVYVNVQTPLVLMNTTPMMCNKDNEEGKKNDLMLTRLQDSCSTMSSCNSASTCSSSITSSSSDRSRPRKLRTKSSRRSRKQDETTVDVFDPNRMPKKSSMKQKDSSSSKGISSSSSNNNDRRKRRGGTIKVYLPGKREPVRRQRSVQFDEEVVVREIQSAISLAKDNNLYALWYQGDENADIKHNIHKLLCRVNHEGVSNTNGRKYCMRGLERYMSPEESRVKRQQAEDAVFKEQFLQRKDGEFDDEQIADIYRQSTRRSQRQASRQGSEDALIAQSILETSFAPRSKSSSTSRSPYPLGGQSFHEKRSKPSSKGRPDLSRSKSM